MRIRLAIVAVCAWASLAMGTEPPRHQEVRQVMGTLATVQVWAHDDGVAIAAVDTAFVVFSAVDSLMSTWNGNSPLSRLNAAPAGTWVPVGGAVGEVLAAAIAASRRTGGAFDPTVLPLMKLWGFRGGESALPEATTLADALAKVDIEAVAVDGTRARLAKPGMAVDLGGIAKGYALDCAAAAMVRMGARGGMLDLGGNLLIFGQGPGHEVGIVDPNEPAVLAVTVPVRAGSVATSGQYERFVTVDGQPYGHILDPRSGWPVPAGLSATVIAPAALLADAMATAVVVLGVQEGLLLLESLPGVEGVIISGDGIQVTSGLSAYVPAR